MHNAATLTNGLSAITCQLSELNASSPERFIPELEVFIYTCFSLSNKSSDLETYVFSMWTVATQTLCLLGELRRKDMIMQSRMETLSLAGLLGRNRAEECLAELIRSQMLRTSASLRRSFLSYSTRWTEVISSRALLKSVVTPTGDLSRMLPSMTHPPELSSEVEQTMDVMNGWRNLELDLACHF